MLIRTPGRRTAVLAFLFALVASAAETARGQDRPDPIHWAVKTDASAQVKAGGKFNAQLVATIDDGWHLYSPDQPPGGPLPTRIKVVEGQPFKLAGEIETPLPQILFDPNFNMETQSFEGEASFALPIAVAADTPAGKHTLTIAVTFQSCNETLCLPPKTVKLTAEVSVIAAAQGASGTRLVRALQGIRSQEGRREETQETDAELQLEDTTRQRGDLGESEREVAGDQLLGDVVRPVPRRDAGDSKVLRQV